MTSQVLTAVSPEPPGRLGAAISPSDALQYLEALRAWRDQRKGELDLLDEMALASSDRDRGAQATGLSGTPGTTGPTGDVLLSMALWKAVADRHDLLMATWDSGRAGLSERERLSTLIWGRLGATLDPQLARRPDVPSSSGALAVSLPEAMRLSDALVASLRARLSLDSADADADVGGRVRQLRAQLERVRDLVAAQTRDSQEGPGDQLSALDARLEEMVRKARRGADVGGLIGPLEADAARAERDLIVCSAKRTEAARDAVRARALRGELEARGAAIRDLAARCVAAVNPAPRLAVPDVAALGPVPQSAAEVDAYLARLAMVSRALNVAHAAYATALDERGELRGRLEAYAAKASRITLTGDGPGMSPVRGDGEVAQVTRVTDPGAAGSDDLDELFRRAQDVLGAEPVDMVRARALVAAHQAYLTSRSVPPAMTRGGS